MIVTKFKRHSIRLRDYDYSEPGAYFLTVCTKERERLFGEINQGEMKLNGAGKIVQSIWVQLPKRFPNIELNEFVIMPNHVHGIISILDLNVGAGFPRPIKMSNNPSVRGAVTAPLQSGSLGQIVAYFKYQSTKQINLLRNMPGVPIWQRNYYEHVIRDEHELFEMRQYTQENPLKWDLDPENPLREFNDTES